MMDAEELRGCRTIREAIEAALAGSSQVEVLTDGFKARRGHDLLQEWSGGGHRILQIRVHGWGTAFEPRRIVSQVLVDLRADGDELVSSVLDQTRTLIQQQTRQRVRAAAKGITAPLDREGFTDLTRLRIDLATAQALHDLLGSDVVVRDWLQEQIGLFHPTGTGTMTRPLLRVQGFRVTVPIDTNPLGMAVNPKPSIDRPVWSDNSIRVMLPDWIEDEDRQHLLRKALDESPLKGRDVTDLDTWPARYVTEAVRRHNAKNVRSRQIDLRSDDTRHLTWEITVERRDVSVIEAFG